MASFEYAIGPSLINEGGFVNNPNDPGKETNRGITLKFLKEQKIIDADYNHDGMIDVRDLKDMPVGDAIKLFKNKWDVYGYQRINSNEIASKIFDMSLPVGQHQATLIAQRACRKINPDIEIFVDGIMGVYTVSAINSLAWIILLPALKEGYSAFFEMLGKIHPTSQEFVNGWLKRAQS